MPLDRQLQRVEAARGACVQRGRHWKALTLAWVLAVLIQGQALPVCEAI
jgi:hypothetical protein